MLARMGLPRNGPVANRRAIPSNLQAIPRGTCRATRQASVRVPRRRLSSLKTPGAMRPQEYHRGKESDSARRHGKPANRSWLAKNKPNPVQNSRDQRASLSLPPSFNADSQAALFLSATMLLSGSPNNASIGVWS